MEWHDLIIFKCKERVKARRSLKRLFTTIQFSVIYGIKKGYEQ